MYGNKYSDQLLPLLTPEMLTRYPDQTCDILNKLMANGLLTLTAGPGMRLLPPLTITKEEMDKGVAIMKATLG